MRQEAPRRLCGVVLAERIASQRDESVLVVERRNHIAGNAFDCFNDDGILIHRYKPHIFHANAKPIFDYLSQFTPWRSYVHRLLGMLDGKLVPIPINLDTVNLHYGHSLTSENLAEWFAAFRYYNMAQIVGQALATFRQIAQDLPARKAAV